jgi:ATP-dependent Clp protease ATP-binding subunit ClpA
MGARPLSRKINDLIKVPLSKKILFENIAEHTTIIVDCQDKTLTFDQTATITQQAIVDNNGFIILEQT